MVYIQQQTVIYLLMIGCVIVKQVKTSNMKISEVIKKLQEIQKEKGDVKVMVCDNENEVYELSEDMIEKCLGNVCIYGV